MYLIGQCYVKLDDQRAALAQFQSVMKRYSGQPRSDWPPSFSRRNSQRQMGHAEDAIAGYRRMLDQSIRETARAIRGSRSATCGSRARPPMKTSSSSGSLARRSNWPSGYRRCSLPLRALQWEARAHQEWGRWLSQTGRRGGAGGCLGTVRAVVGRIPSRGPRVLRLAALRLATRDYPDDLWSGAENYLAGHDYKNAIKVLNEYLKIELRRRRPMALVGLGEALLAQDQPDEALAVLRRAIDDYPRDPAVFKARLLASSAYLAKGSVEPAETVLIANLNDSMLTPASQEWRDSLFALARLLYRVGRYRRRDRATGRSRRPLSHRRAIARGPLPSGDGPCPRGARGSNAKRFRRPRRSSAWRTANESNNPGARRLSNTTSCIKEIVKRQDEKPLSAAEKAMLRNGYFGRAEALFAAGAITTRRLKRTPKSSTATRTSRKSSTPICSSPSATVGCVSQPRPAAHWNKPRSSLPN